MTDTPHPDLEQRLAAVRDKRGYLLPHHGLLALAFPDLLAGYDAAYAAMALADRALSHHDREFVWLAVLAATDESLATHHIAKLRTAGGTDATITAAFAACAGALGATAYEFAARDWPTALAPWNPKHAYLEGVRRLAPLRLVHLAQCAAHVCRAHWRVLGWQLEAAYADAVPEDDIAEALTLAMFPGSVPRFVKACGVWRNLILDGTLPASDRYRTWARLSGQDGFTPAGQDGFTSG
jgi:alkylhydroperoxidase/carboxymuconolactone decarboxylase family protein YurZ